MASFLIIPLIPTHRVIYFYVLQKYIEYCKYTIQEYNILAPVLINQSHTHQPNSEIIINIHNYIMCVYMIEQNIINSRTSHVFKKTKTFILFSLCIYIYTIITQETFLATLCADSEVVG